MPWLAIPFSDTDTIKRLYETFDVMGILQLIFIDSNGKVSTDNGVSIMEEYGVDSYPFSRERFYILIDQKEETKRNQTLSSILVSSSRNYLLSKDGNQVLVSELEGKTVGLLLMSSDESCVEFANTLIEVYNKLKEKGENFEVVLISLNYEEEEFKKVLETIPWLALPYKDRTNEKLVYYFDISSLPTLIIIGPDGKTVNSNLVQMVKELGIDAYPFTQT
uniref:protein-disulfide reductase n=1 Tax=Cannabis sativa TaxID=3483 RepID=A0A803PFK0_CANSA